MTALDVIPAASRATPGPLELLVLQPTPFCNINCSYCYLPDRGNTRRMSRDTLDQAFRWVFAGDLARAPFTVLWHAGEPLVLPVAYYDEATALLQRHNTRQVPVVQSFQTNATLIDAAWCDYFRRYDIDLGVSVDGPAFLHDRYRRTRQGQGTHDRVLRGIGLLNDHGIPYHIISVLTADSLDYPDELFDFYQAQGARSVGFNVEEVEGPHTTSSLQAEGTPQRFRRFLTRFLELALAADPPLTVREFQNAAGALLTPRRYEAGDRTQENKPWAIVNISSDGDFSTFSPELLGLSSLPHGSFSLGNVFRDTVASVSTSNHFRRLEAEIGDGVALCREQCRYFPFCGGGPPANKFFENGTFASTETLFCRLHKKICLDVAITLLEKSAVAQPERAPA